MLATNKDYPLYQEARKIAQRMNTPFLVMDKSVMRRKYEELRRVLPEVEVFYALKANPYWRIARLFHKLGAGFEISSEGELELLLRLKVPPQRIISSNPLKSPSFIQSAHSLGIDHFVFDSSAELEKLSRFASGSKVQLRLSVSNEGSRWPLNKKFGIEIEDGVSLLVQAAKQGLNPYGITFHVGSQCLDVLTWVKAIEKSKLVWELALREGIELRRLNLGGGFPIQYTEPIPPIGELADIVRKTIRANFLQGTELVIEPGRYLVGEAGILVAGVIAKATREGQKWLYLDVGVFNGLMESLGNIKYPLVVEKESSTEKWVLAGPSCDSFDVIPYEVELPELEVGDKVYILSSGAYTTAYASRFNGFPIPETYLI